MIKFIHDFSHLFQKYYEHKTKILKKRKEELSKKQQYVSEKKEQERMKHIKTFLKHFQSLSYATIVKLHAAQIPFKLFFKCLDHM